MADSRVVLHGDQLDAPMEPEALLDFSCAEKWGDGLPIIPPTPERVMRMIEGAGRSGDTVVSALQPGGNVATVEKIAINAVMAGCKPEYMPVLIAIADALGDPEFNTRGVQVTTNPVAVAAVINGPIRHELELNCRRGCLGPGWRANATIGRAIRLILINIGGAIPADVDKAVHGFAGKFSFCFGEDEEGSPWAPLHVERGYDKDSSTVTICAVQDTSNSLTLSGEDSETFLRLAAYAMATPGSNNLLCGGGQPILLLTRGHAQMLAKAGYSKADCQAYLFEHGMVHQSAVGEAIWPGRPFQPTEAGMLRPVKRPEDYMILVAGGDEPYHHQVMHTFGDDSQAVTRVIS